MLEDCSFRQLVGTTLNLEIIFNVIDKVLHFKKDVFVHHVQIVALVALAFKHFKIARDSYASKMQKVATLVAQYHNDDMKI